MSTPPIFPPRYLNALATDCFGPPRRHTDPRAAPALVIEAGFSLAVFTGALSAHLLWFGGKALLNRIRRHVAPPEPSTAAAPRPPVSLRGVPSPEDIGKVWDLDPRTLYARLRIGSRLADLEPTLDARFLFRKTRAGSRRIAARQPGLKGWMRKNVPMVKYSTAMHYKKLVTRLRQLIGLDPRIPLEWLLPDNGEPLPALAPADRRATAAAKARLARLLAGNPGYTHLLRTVENKLGIMRMVTIRRVQPARPKRGRRGKPAEKPGNPLISRVFRGGYCAAADAGRSGAFWEAVRRILGEDNPDEGTRRLQSDIRRWLDAPLEARRKRRR